ncbi:MAG: NHL repeat-containing protein [Spartobacteria bacterium]
MKIKLLFSRGAVLAVLSTLVVLACLRSSAAADLYASDVVTGDILSFAPDSTQTVFSAVGTPRGLAFDAAGNLYVADGIALAIIKVTPDGTQSTFASGLNDPRGIAFDSAGNLFVCNAGNNEILKFTPAGMQSTFVSGLNRPADIVFDSANNLFESDRLSGSLFKFTPAGMQSTFATGLNLPAGLAFDSAGNLFVVEQGTASVLKFASDGTGETFAALDPSDFPIRVAIDENDNVFLSDAPAVGGGLIYQFTPSGAQSTFATVSDTIGFLAFAPVVATPPPAAKQLLNISTRLNVLAGDNALIGGFIIDGTSPKRVIVRAIGPTLGDFGVPNFLANPTLTLNGADGSAISNDNWKDTQQAEIEATGFAPSNDLESAIVATLAPGAYTAVVRGVNDGTGVGLIEAYDLDATTGTLANISTRGFVDTGDNVMIGGFIVGDGETDSTVVVRAIGPTLSDFGVAGALADPTLELHDSNGSTLADNDNWKDTQQTEIEATGLAPGKDLESAIVATLPSGSYTAIVRGSLDTSGVGLVEVYNVQ